MLKPVIGGKVKSFQLFSMSILVFLLMAGFFGFSYADSRGIEMTGFHKDSFRSFRVLERGYDYLVISSRFAPPILRHSPEWPGMVKIENGNSGPGTPGKPEIPSFGMMLSVLPGTSVDVEILYESKPSVLSGVVLRPGPSVTNALLDSGGIESLVRNDRDADPLLRYIPCGEIYASNDFFPTKLVEITGEAIFRDLHLMKLKINPFIYSAGREELHYYREIVFKVVARTGALDGTDEWMTASSELGKEDPFGALYEKAALNFTGRKPNLKNTSVAGRVTGVEESGGSTRIIPCPESGNTVVKIAVEQDGFYRITANALTAAGMNITGRDPSRFSLLNRGEEVAMYCIGGEDHVFDEGDAFIFYGRGLNTPYTGTNIYWLGGIGSPGLRMSRKSLPPGAARFVETYTVTDTFEENNEYLTSYPGGEGKDHWFWNFLMAPETQHFSIQLDDFHNESDSCLVSLYLMGYTSMFENPDHSAQFFLNDHLAGEFFWDGQTAFDTSFSVPADWLHSGDNGCMLTADGATSAPFDIFAFDKVLVTHGRDFLAMNDYIEFSLDDPDSVLCTVDRFSSDEIVLFDITNPLEPCFIDDAEIYGTGLGYSITFQDKPSGKRFYAALDMGSAILEPSSMTLFEPEMNLKNGSNRADYIIITHPDFRDAAEELATFNEERNLVTKVVNVFDIYDQFNFGIFDPAAIRSFVKYSLTKWAEPHPTYLLLLGDATYDYRDYLHSGKVNYVPTHLFESIIYNTETASDNWFAAVLGSDDLPDIMVGRMTAKTFQDAETSIQKTIAYESTAPDTSGSWLERILFVADDTDEYGCYATSCDSLAANYLPAGYSVSRAYLDSIADPQACRDTIVSAMNDGVMLTYYVGHGGIDNWASENIFTSDDISLLTNEQRLTVVVAMDCLNGWFHHVDDDFGLAEEFMRRNSAGAVTNWSTTGWTMMESVEELGGDMFNALFSGGFETWGEVFTAAKLDYLLGGSYYTDLLDLYTQFGDPAITVKVTSDSGKGD